MEGGNMSMVMTSSESAETHQSPAANRKVDTIPCRWNGIDVQYKHSMPVSEISYADLSSNRFKIVTILGRVGGKCSPRLELDKPLPMASQRPGFFFWIPPNVSYWSWGEHVRVLRYLEVQFDLESLEKVLSEELDVSRVMQPSLPIHDSRVATCAGLLADACLVGSEDQLYGESLVTAFLAAVFNAMSRHVPSVESGLAPWQLRIAKAYIEEHFRQDISLTELASLTKLSQSRFARGFRVSTGVPPYTWALRRRVEAAEDLLVSTKMPLSRIALQVGFADQSHLTKVFRRTLGTTPAAWRRDRKE
jgi:AraC family transcriptional regulator